MSVQKPIKGPSDHLSWVELSCRDGTWYPDQWRGDRAVELARAFEWIRERFGGAIHISSGYRTPEYNTSIGGAKFSQHCEGRALDLHPIRRSLWDLERACRDALDMGLIRGLGYYGDFTHIDIRPGRKVVWRGRRLNTEN